MSVFNYAQLASIVAMVLAELAAKGAAGFVLLGFLCAWMPLCAGYIVELRRRAA